MRDYQLLWVLSIGFELMELTFQHMLPNFNECWWDSWILDVAVCNFLGMWAGMKVRTKPQLCLRPSAYAEGYCDSWAHRRIPCEPSAWKYASAAAADVREHCQGVSDASFSFVSFDSSFHTPADNGVGKGAGLHIHLFTASSM